MKRNSSKGTIDENDLQQITQARSNIISGLIRLNVIQEPINGKALSKTAKLRGSRYAIEPPPIVELVLGGTKDSKDNTWMNINSPNWFCKVELEATLVPRSSSASASTSDDLTGSLVASMHKVRTQDNQDHGYFIFGNLNANREGEYRIRFTLFEMRAHDGSMHAARMTSTLSRPFKVHHNKTSVPAVGTTPLSRVLSDNGVKLRVRKEAIKRRNNQIDWTINKHNGAPQAAPQNTTPYSLPIPGSMAPPPQPPFIERLDMPRNVGVDITSRMTMITNSMAGSSDNHAQGAAHYSSGYSNKRQRTSDYSSQSSDHGMISQPGNMLAPIQNYPQLRQLTAHPSSEEVVEPPIQARAMPWNYNYSPPYYSRY